MQQFLFGIISATTLFTLLITAGTIDIVAPKTAKEQVAQQPNCKNPQTQAEMNVCAGIEYQNADKKLNQQYQKLISTLSANRKQKLIAAQKAWLSYRDANCDYEKSEVEGGTLAPTIYALCMADLTKERTTRLQESVK